MRIGRVRYLKLEARRQPPPPLRLLLEDYSLASGIVLLSFFREYTFDFSLRLLFYFGRFLAA